MKVRHDTAWLLAFLLILSGCRKNTIVGHRPDYNQAIALNLHIDTVVASRLPDALDGSTISDEDKRFIATNATTGVYAFVTVKMYSMDGEQILEINQFNLDEWVNSVTGERGTSPHGTRSRFRKIGGGWEIREVRHYGG